VLVWDEAVLEIVVCSATDAVPVVVLISLSDWGNDDDENGGGGGDDIDVANRMSVLVPLALFVLLSIHFSSREPKIRSILSLTVNHS
jgi:hypothetical protein